MINTKIFQGNTTNDWLDNQEIRHIFNSLDIGIHIVDSSGITILYNKTCEEIEGISASWIVGKKMKMLVENGVYSDSVALEVLDKKIRVAKTQKVNEKNIFSTGIPVFEKGKLSKVLVSVMDMSSFKNLEAQLNELKKVNERFQKELEILNAIEIKNNAIISKNNEMKKIENLALRVAKFDSTILIEGESGVGKGLLSKFIHENSNRKSKPFIKIDCSSLPESLIESELFGYEEGAFTGAKKDGKIGLIELSNNGTLFLDEIGEIPLNLQVKLLHVIQDKSFQRVGGRENISVDNKIIVATNKDLYSMVKQGKFREDLYYRLKVIPIRIPPLRERRIDIVPLIKFFLKKLNDYYGYDKTISSKAMKWLIDYNWPGNVRELENEIERLFIISEGDVILEDDILSGDIKSEISTKINEEKTFKENVYDYERVLLSEFLNISNNINELSEKTGLETSSIRKKAKRLGVKLNYKNRN
ncbi:sigma 54-interacting transcriptional regulator [Lutibacter sp. B2]|nr:sigma 54-interacting transcriptional regulator [Lutibacter sp. B2]